MNAEILSVVAPKEYMKCFLEKSLRIDKRSMTEIRQFSFFSDVLDSEKISASCSLGEGNKILGVLKTSKSSYNDSNEQEETNKAIKVIIDLGNNMSSYDYINSNEITSILTKILK